MSTQRTNSALVFVAVLVAGIVVAYAVSRGPSIPEEETTPAKQARPAQAEPAAQPSERPEDTVTQIDQTTDTTYATGGQGDAAGGEPEEAAPPSNLIEAAERGEMDAIAAMIADGANLNQTDDGGRTALMAAAGGGHVEAVFALLNAGADMNLRDNARRSARDYALARYDQDGQTIARILGEAAGPPPVRDPGEK